MGGLHTPGLGSDVARSDWYWCGYPGHFIGASDCCFHLHTRVGNVIVSTVGDYRPRGFGPDPDRKSIGAGRDFETFVFLARDSARPEGEVVEFCEIDTSASNDSEESERQHYEMCARWAAADKQEEARAAIAKARGEA